MLFVVWSVYSDFGRLLFGCVVMRLFYFVGGFSGVVMLLDLLLDGFALFCEFCDFVFGFWFGL